MIPWHQEQGLKETLKIKRVGNSASSMPHSFCFIWISWDHTCTLKSPEASRKLQVLKEHFPGIGLLEHVLCSVFFFFGLKEIWLCFWGHCQAFDSWYVGRYVAQSSMTKPTIHRAREESAPTGSGQEREWEGLGFPSLAVGGFMPLFSPTIPCPDCRLFRVSIVYL